MSAERLLQLYDRVSEAPDAITRLRRFVLDLAVRGKLVEQDPNDEPACELLRQIKQERNGEVQSRKFDSEQLSDWTGEPSAAIPEAWALVPLGDVVIKHLGGGTPSKSNLSYWDGDIRWASVKDVGKAKFLDDTIDRVTSEGLANSPSNLIPPGQLIVVTRMGLGKVSINRVPVAINQDLRALFLSSSVSIDYCFNFFQTHQMDGSGLTVKGIKVSDLLKIPFPLPPLTEQHRIVAKVDKLMALCDSLEAEREKREATRDRLTTASLSRLTAPDVDAVQFKALADFAIKVLPELTTRPDQIKVLRQTILDLAVRGKLVEQDPNDEPANELLKKIKAAKEARVRSGAFPQVKPPVELTNPELEFSIPAGWLWVRLGDVIKVWNGFAFKSSDFRTEGIPVIRIGDLQNGGVMLANAKRVSSDVARSVDSNFWIPEGALLIAMSGATTGKTAINLYKEGLLLNQRVGRIESFGMSIRFVRVFFETIIARNLSIASGTAIPNLSTQQLNATAIPLPPLAEQQRIIAKVDELLALCDQLEQGLDLRRGAQSHLLEGLINGALHSLIMEAA